MKMPRRIKRTLVMTVGGLFIIAGLIGLVLPFLQGIFFLVIGALLLSMYSPAIRGWIDRHAEGHPHLKTVVRKVESWLGRIIGEP